MSSQLRFRRGSTAAHAAFTGADGEVSFNTDTNELVAHDGATAGGFPGGGFVAEGAGAVPRALRAKARESVSLEDFGAVGNGVVDDTLPFANALATGKRIALMEGKIYKVTAPLATAQSLYLSGAATVLFAFAGVGISCTGAVVELNGVTFNGNDQCHRGVHGTGQESVLLTGCTVKNIYGDGLGATGFTTGVRFDGPSRVRISKCTFKKIRALGNNVEGDNAGAVRGVYLRDAIAFGLVDDCYFEDVNNVNGIGTIVTEDSDAVHGQAFTAAEAQYLTVQNCHFVNCGKRAAKFQAGSASVSKFTGNTVVSSWMVTQPAALATVNDSRAMYSAVSCYGGSVTVSHNTVTGGVVGNLLDANDSVADIGAILVANNIHTPLYSKFAVRNNTGRTLLIDCNDPRGTGVKPSLVESGNIFAHTFEGAYVNFGKFITMGNISNAETMTADLISFEHMVAIGNITKGVATATTEKGYWLRDGNTFKSAGFIGNVIEGFYDGIYYGVGLSGLTYKASHVGNLFINEGRNDVSEFTAAGDKANYTYTGNNTTKATNSLVSLRGVTAATATLGAAGAPPAQVSAYETVVINATTYKRPLYNP